ncbi:MAG: PEP-CTERM sorting domain-containing protein, partial [Planctomycetota bacterium]
DASFSQDIQVAIVDDSGNRLVLGSGFAPVLEAGLSWTAGAANGTDGLPEFTDDAGNYGAIFTPGDWAADFAAFGTGSPGTFSVNFQDGWNGAGNVTTFLGNATVVITATAVPEPSSFAMVGLLTCGLAIRRRRHATNDRCCADSVCRSTTQSGLRR